jgi:uncharacterized membrane-anchored protein
MRWRDIGACLATVIGAIMLWANLRANSFSPLARWLEVVVIGVVVGAVWWYALRPRTAPGVASPLNHRTTS